MKSAVQTPVQFELEIKKSRFIAFIEPIDNKAHAKALIEDLWQRYPDARHVCYSFITNSDTAMNDDGEPSGTAGKPIYNVLQHKNLNNVLAVVVRYFGGIKLGAGGLTRAYGGAVSQALELCTIITPVAKSQFTLTLPFELENKVRHLMSQHEAALLEVQYSHELAMQVEIEEDQAAAFLEELSEKGQGKIAIAD